MLKCYNHEEHTAVGMCTTCGKAICDTCKMEIQGKLICKKCAEKKLEEELQNNNKQPVINPQIPQQQMQMYPMDLTKKNKDVAAMLAVFGGWFGLHKFYLNKPGQGIAMALFSGTGIPLIISLAEAYSYFASTEERFDRKYNEALFTYKNQLQQPQNPMLNQNVTPHPTAEEIEKHRIRNKFRKDRIIDLENDLVDEKKREEERIQKEQEDKKDSILDDNAKERKNIDEDKKEE